MTIQTESEERIRLHNSLLPLDLVELIRRRLLACCHTSPRVEGEVEAALRDFGLSPLRMQPPDAT